MVNILAYADDLLAPPFQLLLDKLYSIANHFDICNSSKTMYGRQPKTAL